MEFQDVVRRRRMVRAFDGRPLDDTTVERILANGLRAPSAGYSQGWAFLVLEEAGDRARFWASAFPGTDEVFAYRELHDAPLVVVPLSHKDAYLDRYAEPDKGWIDRDEARWPVPYWHIDTGFSALLMLLTAVDAGLGALFFGIFPANIDRFRETFAIPPAYTPIGALAIGHPHPDDRPSGSPLTRPRRSAQDVIHRGRW